MYSNICQWFSEWYKLEDRNFPLDTWELEYIRDNVWDEWDSVNEHIDRTEETQLKEREVIDCLLLTAMNWAKQKINKFTLQEADHFVEAVKSKKQTEQHTAEWHAEKVKLLTASEFGYIVGNSPSARKGVYERKFEKMNQGLACMSPMSPTSPTGDSTPVGVSNDNLLLPATIWGHRFEPIARLLASKLFFNGGNILDNIGRIVHETHKNLAASPDGLIEEGPYKGNLIEIKCPITRIPIEEEILHDYYCQTQIQMEVLNCPIVEFVEMKFKQFKELPEETKEWCGILAVIQNDYTLRYEYGPFSEGLSPTVKGWQPVLKDNEFMVEKTFWILENSHWMTVHRNKFWWTEIGYPAYQKFWADFDQKYKEWEIKNKESTRCLFTDD